MYAIYQGVALFAVQSSDVNQTVLYSHGRSHGRDVDLGKVRETLIAKQTAEDPGEDTVWRKHPGKHLHQWSLQWSPLGHKKKHFHSL